MAEHPIQWLNQPGYKGETLNPIRAEFDGRIGWHCEKVAAGCRFCYAEATNKAGRFMGTKLPYGLASREKVIHEIYFPTLKRPLHWKKPRMIFWQDMGDLFGEWVTENWITQVFRTVDATPQHLHVFCTKRPENVLRMWPATSWSHENSDDALYRPNVWLLYSASDQESLESGLPHLLECLDLVPVLGLSLEPLIGPVVIPPEALDQLDWIIVGGESGQHARPCSIEWVRSIRNQCSAAGVAFYFKQAGAKPFFDATPSIHDGWGRWAAKCEIVNGHWWPQFAHPKGGDPSEWPEDMRVRQWPNPAEAEE